MGGLFSGLVFGLAYGLAAGWTVGLVATVMTGLTGTLAAGLSQPGADDASPLTPTAAWRRDQAFGLVVGVVLGTGVGPPARSPERAGSGGETLGDRPAILDR